MMTFGHSLSASYIREIRDIRFDDTGRVTVKRNDPRKCCLYGCEGKQKYFRTKYLSV